MEIGKGTFGLVRAENGLAVKTLLYQDNTHMESIIQEIIILEYLKGFRNIVQIHSFNLQRKEIKTVLYSCSLKEAFLKYEIDYKGKLTLMKDILYGVSMMHTLGLVHCDLKMSNTLVNGPPFRAVIADFGLSSLASKGRFSQTPKLYRRNKEETFGKRIIIGDRHDIYSLAVMFTELFRGSFFREDIDENRLQDEIIKLRDDGLIDDDVYLILFEMSVEKSDLYPDVRSIMDKGFGIKDAVAAPPIIPFEIKRIISEDMIRYVKNSIKNICDKRKIHGRARGYKCLMERFNKESKIWPVVPREKYNLYILCMIFIMSTLFGENGFSYDDILEGTEHKFTDIDINMAMTDLISKEEIRNILLMQE